MDYETRLIGAKPCPFCGEHPRVASHTATTGNLRIVCGNQDCPGCAATNWGAFDAMLKNWNTRSYPEIPDGSST